MLRRKPKRKKRANWRTFEGLVHSLPKVESSAMATALPEVKEALERETVCRRQWLTWLHDQPCVFGQMAPSVCSGKTEAAHRDYGKGMGMKTSDDTMIPLCRRHHRLLGGGLFETDDERRDIKRALHQALMTVIRQRYLARGTWTPMGKDLPW